MDDFYIINETLTDLIFKGNIELVYTSDLPKPWPALKALRRIEDRIKDNQDLFIEFCDAVEEHFNCEIMIGNFVKRNGIRTHFYFNPESSNGRTSGFGPEN